jgi:hypothetical protein
VRKGECERDSEEDEREREEELEDDQNFKKQGKM